MAGRAKALVLYRRILTLHRAKLEPRMRVLGNQYVRDEFRRHKDAAPKFVPMFLREWEQYAELMERREDSQVGKAMSEEERALLDGEQKLRLKSLKDAAKLVGETIA